MLRLAGQTGGRIGLKFFVDTHGCFRLKNLNLFFNILHQIFKKKIFHWQRRNLQLVNTYCLSFYSSIAG